MNPFQHSTSKVLTAPIFEPFWEIWTKQAKIYVFLRGQTSSHSLQKSNPTYPGMFDRTSLVNFNRKMFFFFSLLDILPRKIVLNNLDSGLLRVDSG